MDPPSELCSIPPPQCPGSPPTPFPGPSSPADTQGNRRSSHCSPCCPIPGRASQAERASAWLPVIPAELSDCKVVPKPFSGAGSPAQLSLLQQNPGSEQTAQSLKRSNLLPSWSRFAPSMPTRGVQPSVSGRPANLLTAPGERLQAPVLLLPDSLQGSSLRPAHTRVCGQPPSPPPHAPQQIAKRRMLPPTQGVPSSSWTYCQAFLNSKSGSLSKPHCWTCGLQTGSTGPAQLLNLQPNLGPQTTYSTSKGEKRCPGEPSCTMSWWCQYQPRY